MGPPSLVCLEELLFLLLSLASFGIFAIFVIFVNTNQCFGLLFSFAIACISGHIKCSPLSQRIWTPLNLVPRVSLNLGTRFGPHYVDEARVIFAEVFIVHELFSFIVFKTFFPERKKEGNVCCNYESKENSRASYSS